MSGRTHNGVPNGPVREALLASGVPLHRVAWDLGYQRTYRLPGRAPYRAGDGTRLKRQLGMQANRSAGRATYQTEVREDVALRILERIGRDPVEVGL